MTTDTGQKTNLARIRDNQRRSRARRREYLQELEQRLRACELQGIQATAQVQMAARRVLNENTQLRELLHKYGASDDYIAQYLQSVAANKAVDSQGQAQHVQVMDPIMTPPSLQQLMLPRQAAHLEPGFQLTLPGDSSREASTASGSTINSSAWEYSPPTMTSYSHQPQQLGLVLSSISPSEQQQYSPSMFQAQDGGTQANPFQRPRSEHLSHDAQQSMTTSPHIPIDDRAVMSYPFQMIPFDDSARRLDSPRRM